MRDDNDAFGFDLGFAIWQALRKRIGLDDCRRLTAVVIKHLRLCGVVVVQDTADGRAWLKDNSVGANCPLAHPTQPAIDWSVGKATLPLPTRDDGV